MLAYERVGSGEPLVLIHGIGHRRQAWYPVLDQLAEHREVIIFDLPGHGESPDLVADGRPIVEVLHDHLIEFLDAMDVERPHMAGNSLGGRIAMEAAVDGLARSVTALAPAGFWKDERDFTYIRALFATMTNAAARTAPFADQLSRTAAGRAAMFSWLTRYPGRVSPEQAAGDARNLVASRRALRTIITGGTPFDREFPSDVPLTIAWGTHDRVLRPYQARRARRLLPNATHVLLPQCGHVPMTDHPELVAKVILRGSGGITAKPAPKRRPARQQRLAAAS